MNTPNPTPDPLVEQIAAAIHRYDVEHGINTCYAPNEHHRAEARAALEVLDLPARDARIRAETLRWAAAQWDAKAERSAELPSANLGQSWQRYQLTESLTGVAEWCRAEATAIENGANAPAESVAAGSVVSTPDPRRRCPNESPDPSEAVVEAWQNFTSEHAEYRERMGDNAGPPHSRITIEHSCGWSVSFAAGPQSWAKLAGAVLEHFGQVAPNWVGKGFPFAVQPSVVSTEGSGHPHPHGDDDGHDGYMSTRCEEGRPGCVGRGCICRCHADQPGPGRWTGPRPTLTPPDTKGDTDANH